MRGSYSMVEASKPVVIIDPTDEREPIKRSLAKRPEHISGTLGLLDISKHAVINSSTV